MFVMNRGLCNRDVMLLQQVRPKNHDGGAIESIALLFGKVERMTIRSNCRVTMRYESEDDARHRIV